MIIIVDSDGLIGNLVPQDQHHKISQQISRKLAKKGAKLIYPATTIAETVTFLQGRLDQPGLANQVVSLATVGKLFIELVDSETIKNPSTFTDFKKSKHNTLF